MANEVEKQIDAVLADLETQAAKIGKSSKVLAEVVEIDFINLVDKLSNLIERMVHDDKHRDELKKVLGAPYTRLARIKYIVDATPLSQARAKDRRWADLAKHEDVAESVLKDLDGAEFRSLQDMQNVGAFRPAFGGGGGGGGYEQAEPPKAAVAPPDDGPEDLFENSDDDWKPCPAKAKKRASVQEIPVEVVKEQATASAPCVSFAAKPSGPCVRVLKEGRVVARLADDEDLGTLSDLVDDVADVAKDVVVGTQLGRMLVHGARKLMSRVRDDGCTAMSAMPIQKFRGIGQYAEVVVRSVRSEIPLGCVGIGITRLGPSVWSGFKFPERLDDFPHPSWTFSGPYKGHLHKVYVDGKKVHKYTPDEEFRKWNKGDRVGILIRPNGKLCLYHNSKMVVSLDVPGFDKMDLDETPFWLLVEAFGNVCALSLPDHLDPSKLPDAYESLSSFLG